MRTVLRSFGVVLLTILFSLSINAQSGKLSNNPWEFTVEPTLKNTSQVRQIIPMIYQTAKVDLDALKYILQQAPQRFSEAAINSPVVLTLPMADGGYAQFEIQEASIMHPELAAKFPAIQSYSGQGIDDPTALLRFDLTPKGFHAMIRSGDHSTVYIDPYSTNNTEDYVVYFRKDFAKTVPEEQVCHFDEFNPKSTKTDAHKNSGNLKMAGDCDLRTFRLALACTGEYAAFHGGTVAGAMAAMNTSMVRVNGIFEQDAGLTMQLVPNNDQIIYLNASTDPYTNGSGGAMLGENQSTCDNVIGSTNYDIGHVFSTGGGGVAYLQSPCNNNIKAGGVTGQSSPVGDPFDVDYVAHEMGHQYGANHTQNNSCNRNSSTTMEPGSASTIMGYAGICSPNVQNNSDDHFHGISLQEIGNFIVGNNSNCAVTTTTGNNPPTVAGGPNHTIPGGTKFMLTATGNDPDGVSSLTYCWEQFDNEVGSMPPAGTNTVGPMFRSISPSADPIRYFPNIDAIVNNVSPTWEVLPTVDRTMDFRVSVRDNNPGAGCTDEDDVTVTVDGNTGPFLVTAPNTNVTWPAGSTQTVTWDVAGTTASPVNAANVDILLSTDGGYTYPITILTGVTNDGTQNITVPNNPTTTARIMVRGSNNIFFDISNQNFTIDGVVDDFFLAVTPAEQTICQPQNGIYTVMVTSTGTFAGNVSLSATGLPAGATATFSPTSINTAGNSTLTIGNTSATTPGIYPFTVSATGSTGTKTEQLTITIAAGAPETISLISPPNGANSVSGTPTLTWNAAAGATSYDVEVSQNPNFSPLVASANVSGTSYTVSSTLQSLTTYYWRVRGTSSCGIGNFSGAFSFTTANETCNTFVATNVPISISSSGTPTITSTMNIGDAGTITDINLTNLNISHTYIQDLVISLTSPQGTTVVLIDEICGSQNNILINLDDETSNSYASIPCPPTAGGTYQPNNLLAAFDGEDLNGTWILTVNDNANQDGGSLNNWELGICYEPISTDPLSVVGTATGASCNGSQNGTATASASGGTGNYTYSWSNGGSGPTISGLGAGIYSVTVNDGNTTTSTTLTVGEPNAISLSLTGIDLDCNSDNSGSATANASGGNFSYNWSNGDTGTTITNLVAGTYTVTATNIANQCTATSSVTITQPNALGLEITTTDAGCNDNDGTANATVSGGTGNITYAWSNGQSSATIVGLAAGTYSVTATDGNLCTDVSSFTIGQTISTLSLSATATNANCEAENGTAIASAMGGTGNITYEWSNGDIGPNIDNLAPGSYTVTATDANGCSGTASVQVNQIASTLQVTLTATDASCDATDGTATATAFGGTGNIVYNWDNGQLGSTIGGLAPGLYFITATDANGCTATGSTVVNQAGSTIQVSASATNANCTANDGTATASANGGAGSYSYLWNTGQTGATIENLAPGTYSVSATDANGCEDETTVQVGQNGSTIQVSISTTNESCDGEDGTATATATGGNNPITFLWSNGDSGASIAGLPSGNYTVTATDSNGCTETTSATVDADVNLEITIANTNIDCFGGNDGTATVTIQGGSLPYATNWSNNENTTTITNLTSGQYSVTVTDGNGCLATGNVFISEPQSLNITVLGTNANGGNNGSATANVNGETPPYTYFWNTAATTQTIENLAPAVYSVTVTDANGCTTNDNVIIEDVTPPNDEYCESGGINTNYEWIENVTIGGLNNPSGNNNGYGDFTGLITNLIQGGSANVALTPGFANSTYNENWRIWIDFNQDGDFADAGELVLAPAATSGSINANFGIPMTAHLGETRMRISMKWGGVPTPCESFTYGEVEDYTVNIATGNGGNECETVVINTNNFENGWGIWNDGGSDCRRSINDANYANSGNYCVRLRDNTNSSTMTTDVLNLSSFEEITIDFTYIARSMDNANEDFWLQISTDGGQLFNTLEEWNRGDEFENNVREFDAVTIGGPFTPNTVFRFRCDASGNSDWVYIDDVTIAGCTNVESTIFDQNNDITASIGTTNNVQNVVTGTTVEDIQLTVYPNPVKGELTVSYQLPTVGDAMLSVFDLTGKVVIQQSVENTQSRNNRMVINVQHLNNGYYYLRMIGENESKTVKFLKF